MQAIVKRILRTLAHATIRRFQPTVIAVTGSVGKTSAKDAIAAIAGLRGTVRKNAGNLNNEIGVPLAIFGREKSAGVNPFFWFRVLCGALWKLVRGGAYPKYLVLEMAADHPGDIAYLTRIAPPDIGVVTAISPVHMEFYRNIDQVTEEKFGVIRPLTEKGFAILNGDDERVRPFASHTEARAILYGRMRGDVRASDEAVRYGPALHSGARRSVLGMDVMITVGQEKEKTFLSGVIGEGFVLSALAAVAVGTALNVPLKESAAAIGSLRFPPGRMRILEGADDLLLIDDSYNASPKAMAMALAAVAGLDPSAGRPVRRFAVLGSMAELGGFAPEAHKQVGREVALQHYDQFIAVGRSAREMVQGAEAAGMPSDASYLAESHEAAVAHLKTVMQPGDVVLIKGSQASRMERVTRALLKDRSLAPELLVRQGKEWEKKTTTARPMLDIQG
jgi:UDP-N-acetylmuramoyl-tripeptide--D-alanyl-D-alanine ligase